MKVAIEQIEGVDHTVVWHCGERVIMWRDHLELKQQFHGGYNLYGKLGAHIATALPPLPRNPTPKDLRLLNYYESYGLTPMCGQTNILHRVYEYLSTAEWGGLWADYDDDYELSHAINDQNERVEIAITEGKGDE